METYDIKENESLNLSRQTKLFFPTEDIFKIHIFGCGSIGSNILWQAVKSGFKNITIYDYDIVEDANIASQCFGKQDIGTLKIEAMIEKIKTELGITINPPVPYEITKDTLLTFDATDIVINSFDGVENKNLLFQTILKAEELPAHYLDCRTGGFIGELKIVDLSKEEEKKDYLEDLNSGGFSPLVCGTKGLFAFNSIMSGLAVMWLIEYFNTNKNPSKDIYFHKLTMIKKLKGCE
jgi:molybdopterin/thiamine biosynthesis adenylyltransferase